MSSLDQSYDEYPRIEEAFQARLDESLRPRGPDFLYEVVAGLGLSSGASVLDLGCGEGRNAIPLAERFGFSVVGIDPVRRHIELSTDAAVAEPRGRVGFAVGTAEALPLADASFDLIWCKEVLVLVEDVDRTFAECRRVLQKDGRMLIYQVSPTERMEPREGAYFSQARGASPVNIEAAFTGAGFVAEQTIELTSEGGEYGEETSGAGTRRLLHAARLLRSPERYIAEFGQTAYDIMLGDCFWHVYRMIGKLSARVYVLKVG